MDLAGIRSYVGEAGEHVGDVLWWELEAVKIKRQELEALWLAEGLSPKHLPESPTPEKALKTAVREAQVGLTDRLIRLGKDDADQLIYAIVRESRDGTGSVAYQQEARVSLDRHTARISTDDYSHDLAASICTAYEHLLDTHTHDDVRRSVLRVLDSCASVTLRDHGGVYWVPTVHADTIRSLQRALEHVGHSRLHLLPIHATPEGAQTLGEAARASIEDELTSLGAEIEGFLTEPPERASTLTRRLEVFEGLRAKAGLYRDVLRVQVDDLEARITEMTATVESLLAPSAAPAVPSLESSSAVRAAA